MSQTTIAKRAVAMFAVATAVFSLAACGANSSDKNTSSSNDVQIINIAGVTGKKPYTYVNGDNYTGYDFELLKKLMRSSLNTSSNTRPLHRTLFSLACKAVSMTQPPAPSTVRPSASKLSTILRIRPV